jgi:hypothetical protein
VIIIISAQLFKEASQPVKPQKYMGSIKKNNKQRNYKRFKVQKGVFMQIRGLLNLCCKIINVSRGGLAFIYNDFGNRPGEKVDLDIFLKNEEIPNKKSINQYHFKFSSGQKVPL